MKNIFITFIGVAASGKTEIARHICKKYGFSYIPSLTTRPVRPGNESEYHHITKEEFEDLIEHDEILEYAIFNTYYYGKSKKVVNSYLEKNNCVNTVTTDRAEELKNIYPEMKLVLVSPKSPIHETAEKRMHGRGVHHLEEIASKLKTVDEDLATIDDLKKKGLVDFEITTVDEDHDIALNMIDEFVEKI